MSGPFSLPSWLSAELLRHRNAHAPRFSGYLSDHTPMAAMAMWWLGYDRYAIVRHIEDAAGYLEPIEKPGTLWHWGSALGQLPNYAAFLDYFDQCIARDGIAETLNRHLPALTSGWVKDAFHPMIRLAYGRRFGCTHEVSAGMAYLASVGPVRLERLAARSQQANRFDWPARQAEGATFNERLDGFLSEDADSCVGMVDDHNIYAEAVLDLMNGAHDFFALHLVTGHHAFKVSTDGLASVRDEWLATGLVAGYVAAGSPDFVSGVAPHAFHTDFEHEIKLAFTCHDYAKTTGSAAYRAAAIEYGSTLS